MQHGLHRGKVAHLVAISESANKSVLAYVVFKISEKKIEIMIFIFCPYVIHERIKKRALFYTVNKCFDGQSLVIIINFPFSYMCHIGKHYHLLRNWITK